MKIIKIGRTTPGCTPIGSARIFNEKKAKALDEAYKLYIPKWYTSLALRFPILGKLVRVKIRYASINKEIIEIHFLGKCMEEITFIYF